MFVKIMFMYRNNEESKSFEVFFFFFGGVGKRHPLFSSLFSVIRNPKTIKNPENCKKEKKNLESFNNKKYERLFICMAFDVCSQMVIRENENS